MHTQRTNRFRAILVASALGIASVSGAASSGLVLDEPPTMQEAIGFVQYENWGEAISAYRAIIKADKSNAQAHFMLGYALHASGDIDNAIMAHKKASKMPEVAGMAFYNLGCAYALKGEASDAFKALKSAIDLGVRDTEQFNDDPDLKSLKKDERWRPMIKSIGEISKAETAMHFWVGTWDCYSTQSGKLSGKNTLAFRVNSNVIHESWISQGGGITGESWNVYDRVANVWRQTWVDNTGGVLTIAAPVTSEYEGLMFEGKSTSMGDESKIMRMHVRPIDDGRVLQTGFESKDKGKSWDQMYELIYVPAGEEFAFEPDAED